MSSPAHHFWNEDRFALGSRCEWTHGAWATAIRLRTSSASPKRIASARSTLGLGLMCGCSALDNGGAAYYTFLAVVNHEKPATLMKGKARRTAKAMISPSQLRAARALLDWSQPDLAERSGVSIGTIKTFEKGRSEPKRPTLIAWRNAFAQSGVVFVYDDDAGGDGVRFRKERKPR